MSILNFACSLTVTSAKSPDFVTFGMSKSLSQASDKIFIAEEKFFAFDYISVKVSGISEATMDKAVAFCMFVRDGEKVYYLDGGKTVDTVTMKSYNELVSTAE